MRSPPVTPFIFKTLLSFFLYISFNDDTSAIAMLGYTVDRLERDPAAPSRIDTRSPYSQGFRDLVRQFAVNDRDRGEYFRDMIEQAWGSDSAASDGVTRLGNEYETE